MIVVCVSMQQLEGLARGRGFFFEIRCSEIASEALLSQKLPLENCLQFSIQFRAGPQVH